MKTFEINGHRIVLYNDVEQMNVVRYHKFNKMCTLESGVGSDMKSVLNKLRGISRHIEDGKPKNALAEVKNLSITLDFTQRMFDPQSMAFSALVSEIDGEQCNDLSDEGLARVSEKIGRIFTKAGLDEEVNGIKKKSKPL